MRSACDSGAQAMLLEESLLRRGSAVQDDLDIAIASACRIVKQRRRRLLPQRPGCIAKPIKSVAQRPTPFLVPVRILPGIASAIGAPPLHSVAATPRRIFANLRLRRRRKFLQKLSVVRQMNFTTPARSTAARTPKPCRHVDGGDRSFLRRSQRGPAARARSLSRKPRSRRFVMSPPLFSSPSNAMAREVGPS